MTIVGPHSMRKNILYLLLVFLQLLAEPAAAPPAAAALARFDNRLGSRAAASAALALPSPRIQSLIRTILSRRTSARALRILRFAGALSLPGKSKTPGQSIQSWFTGSEAANAALISSWRTAGSGQFEFQSGTAGTYTGNRGSQNETYMVFTAVALRSEPDRSYSASVDFNSREQDE